jgi:hypothetical protein
MVYDKRFNDKRINLKMILPETYVLQEQLEIFNRKLITKYDDSYDLFPRQSSSNNQEEKLKLPNNVYIHIYNDKKTLVFQKSEDKVRLCIRQTLPDVYDMNEEILKLNKAILAKYGISYAILNETVNQTQHEETINAEKHLPQNVYIQMMNEKPYMVFNKKENNKRMSLSILLPPNYQRNKELARIHSKIVEKYGQQYAFDLTEYPYTEKQLSIPENIYINSKCKQPYMFMQCNDEDTTSVLLPSSYDIETQIANYHSNHPTKDVNMMSQQYKDEYQHILPENVCMSLKDGKHILLYAFRKANKRHYISLTLPTGFYNMNLHLILLNRRIIDKYGKEYAILISA